MKGTGGLGKRVLGQAVWEKARKEQEAIQRHGVGLGKRVTGSFKGRGAVDEGDGEGTDIVPAVVERLRQAKTAEEAEQVVRSAIVGKIEPASPGDQDEHDEPDGDEGDEEKEPKDGEEAEAPDGEGGDESQGDGDDSAKPDGGESLGTLSVSEIERTLGETNTEAMVDQIMAAELERPEGLPRKGALRALIEAEKRRESPRTPILAELTAALNRK